MSLHSRDGQYARLTRIECVIDAIIETRARSRVSSVLKQMPSYLHDDRHAGGMISLIAGVVFVTVGTLLYVLKKRKAPLPLWRKSTAIGIIVIGCLATIAGVVLMSIPASKTDANMLVNDKSQNIVHDHFISVDKQNAQIELLLSNSENQKTWSTVEKHEEPVVWWKIDDGKKSTIMLDEHARRLNRSVNGVLKQKIKVPRRANPTSLRVLQCPSSKLVVVLADDVAGKDDRPMLLGAWKHEQSNKQGKDDDYGGREPVGWDGSA